MTFIVWYEVYCMEVLFGGIKGLYIIGCIVCYSVYCILRRVLYALHCPSLSRLCSFLWIPLANRYLSWSESGAQTWVVVTWVTYQ